MKNKLSQKTIDKAIKVLHNKIGVRDAHTPMPTAPTRSDIEFKQKKWSLLLENNGHTITLLDIKKNVLQRKKSPTFTLDIKQTSRDIAHWLTDHVLIKNMSEAEKVTTKAFVSLRKEYVAAEKTYEKELKKYRSQMDKWRANNPQAFPNIEAAEELTQRELAYKFVEEQLKECKFISTGEPERATIYRYHHGIYLTDGKQFIYNIVERELGEQGTKYLKNEVIQHLYSRTVQNKFPEAPPELLCLKNGILNVHTLEFKPHTPDIPFLQKIRIQYDINKKCPEIEKFLSEVAQQKDIPTLKQWAGYMLLREYPFAKMLILQGEGENGKTTFLNFLAAFLGEDNISHVALQDLQKNFAIQRLYGTMANIMPDMNSKAISDTSIFKKLTGQDKITADRKFKDHIDFTSYAKQMFSVNEPPEILEDTVAVWRRIMLIEFKNRFTKEKADPYKIKKITTDEELSGFLNYALDGLHDLFKANGFQEQPEVREEYIRKSDSIMAFIMDNIHNEPKEQVVKSELFSSYCQYCADQGYDAKTERLFFTQFPLKLPKDFRCVDAQTTIDGKRQRVFKGITCTPYTPPHLLMNEEEKEVYTSKYDTILEGVYINNRTNGVHPVQEDSPVQDSERVKDQVLYTVDILQAMPEFKRKGGVDGLSIMEHCNLSDDQLTPVLNYLKSIGELMESKPDCWRRTT